MRVLTVLWVFSGPDGAAHGHRLAGRARSDGLLGRIGCALCSLFFHVFGSFLNNTTRALCIVARTSCSRQSGQLKKAKHSNERGPTFFGRVVSRTSSGCTLAEFLSGA